MRAHTDRQTHIHTKKHTKSHTQLITLYSSLDYHLKDSGLMKHRKVVSGSVSVADHIINVCCCAQSFVYANNLYYQASPTDRPVQVTTSGDPLYVFNGVPDWLYEGYSPPHSISYRSVYLTKELIKKPLISS